MGPTLVLFMQKQKKIILFFNFFLKLIYYVHFFFFIYSMYIVSEIKWTLILKSTHQCIHLEVNRVKLWLNIYLFKKMLPRVLPTLINLS